MKTDHLKKPFFEQLEAFLFSRKFIFIVVIAGTIPMILHTHQLFYKVSPFMGNDYLKNAYALFYALSFDMTILVFTIHFIKRKPELYAIFAFIINLLYFNPFGFISQDWLDGFTKVFLSGILAFTGYSYAELFVEKVVENRKKSRKQKVYRKVNNPVDGSRKLQSREFKCTKCGKQFHSVKALNGHMVAHR